MSSASQFFGAAKPPKLLVGSNDTDTMVVLPIAPAAFDTALGAKLNLRVTSAGTTTANVYKSLVSVSGSGVLSMALLQSLSAGPRDIFIKITIDGFVVLERQKNAAAFYHQINAVGSVWASGGSNSLSFVSTDHLSFSTSLDISVKSSLSETDQIAIAYRYHTT